MQTVIQNMQFLYVDHDVLLFKYKLKKVLEIAIEKTNC